MKTVYTDRYGIFPWAMLLVAGGMFWSAYNGFVKGNGGTAGLSLGAGAVFLTLALRRFWDSRQAKHEGRDPSIIRITNAQD